MGGGIYVSERVGGDDCRVIIAILDRKLEIYLYNKQMNNTSK